MDLSAISYKSVQLVASAAVGAIATAIGMSLKLLDLRQKLGAVRRDLQQAKDEAQARRAVEVRAARENAVRLEGFAHACSALITENSRARRAREGVSFHLPKLAIGVPAGDTTAALELESAYRDLQQRIQSVNQHIEETCRDDYNAGHEEGLIVLNARAYETAASALQLARRYRTSFDVPRTTLGFREQRIEEEIFARAAEENG